MKRKDKGKGKGKGKVTVHTLHTLFAILAAMLLTACIGEDECSSAANTVLEIKYPDFSSRISGVRVGIFDASGNFVTEKTVSGEQSVPLYLDAGYYTAVCWGNALDNTRIDGFSNGQSIDRVRVYHPAYTGSLSYATPDVIDSNDSLYYGIISFIKVHNIDLHETVTFKPAHVRLIITLAGLSNTQAGTLPQDYPLIRVNNLKAVYDQNMNTLGDNTTYIPQVEINPSEQIAIARCDVLRFADDNPIVIEVIKSAGDNTVLYSVSLKEFMASNNINIIDGQEAVIPLRITFSGSNVSVTLEGWESIPAIPKPPR
jgi:hypothetical protein